MNLSVPILAYHKISDKFDWSINNVSIRKFWQQIKYLHDHHFFSLTIENFLSCNFEHDPKRRPILITFDDGDESVYHHAFPILRQAGFVATVFLVSDFVGRKNSWDANLFRSFSRHLSWQQIEQLAAAGWSFGSHTATHADLTRLPRDQIFVELLDSKQDISAVVGQEVGTLAYPFSQYNLQTINIARQVGYQAGFILANPKANLLKSVPAAFLIPRYGVYRIDTIQSLQKKLDRSKVELIKQRLISFCSLGTIWYKRLKI